MALTERYISVAGSVANDGTSEADAADLVAAIALIEAGQSAGYRWNIKKGAYTAACANTLTITADGTTISPAILRGYNSSIGDLDELARDGSGVGELHDDDFPLLAFASTKYLFLNAGNLWVLQNLKITGSYNGNLLYFTSAGGLVKNCSVSNTNTGSSTVGIFLGGEGAEAINCDVSMGSSGGDSGIRANAIYTHVIDCMVISTKNVGVFLVNDACVALRNRICKDAPVGISVTAAQRGILIDGNTIYNPDIGIQTTNVAGSFNKITVINNHITDATNVALYNAYGAEQAAATIINNRFRGNVSGDVSGFDNWSSGASWKNVTTNGGTYATDYVDAENGDLRLISAAPGKATGSVPSLDIGALQRAEPTPIKISMSGGCGG